MDRNVLLNNLDKMITKSTDYTPLSCGSTPNGREIKEYIKYSIINLDKPSNPSSHEVVSWIKKILECEKTGHCGTLDPKVSGTLIVCVNRATRIAKSMQSDGKTYVCTIRFSNRIEIDQFKNVAEKFRGCVLQRPPLMSAVKRQLRLRNIYNIEVIDFDDLEVLFKVDCESGTYIRTLCEHIGILAGNKAYMKELRRIRSGIFTEETSCTMHDVLDAFYLYKNEGDDSVIRKVFQPLETLLIKYKKIMIKDSCVAAICAGAQLAIGGIIKYDDAIEINDMVVLITSKGEAVALVRAKISSSEIRILDHGIVSKTKRVIMDKNLYPSTWGFKKIYEVQSG